jgi:hypothetical protein
MSRQRSIVTPRLIMGLVLIFAGALFGLEQMDYDIDTWEILRIYWPVILILAGLGKLLFGGGRFFGFFLTLLGGWLLAYHLNYVDVDPFDFWPLLLVVLGVRIVGQGLFGRRPAPGDSSSTVDVTAVLGGTRRTSQSQDFRGGNMTAVMGGCEVDLRQARISDPPAVIDAFAFWGGVEIKVPRSWHVETEGLGFLGGYVDNTIGPEDDEELSGPRQKLLVKGFAIMGGVEIKNS